MKGIRRLFHFRHNWEVGVLDAGDSKGFMVLRCRVCGQCMIPFGSPDEKGRRIAANLSDLKKGPFTIHWQDEEEAEVEAQ